MYQYHMELHGRLLECRASDWGSESVLVDGRLVSNKVLAGWWTGLGGTVSHRFTIRDEGGAERHIEVRWETRPRSLGLAQQVRVVVDGRERAVLDVVKSKGPGCCANCGYSLAGLEVADGEVKCPECGRHTDATAAGLG